MRQKEFEALKEDARKTLEEFEEMDK